LFRATLHLDQTTDVDDLLRNFRLRCSRAEFPERARDVLVDQVAATVQQLADRGREVAAVGGALSLTRTIEDIGYKVEIRAGFGHRPSLFDKLKSVLRR